MTLSKKSLITLLLTGLIVANIAYAGLVPCGGEGQPDCDLCYLWQLGDNVINFISFNLAIPAAILLFVAAGVVFLTSGGSQQRVDLARSIFTNTVIGLVIIFVSWLLIDTLFKSLVSGEVIGAWNQFPTCP